MIVIDLLLALILLPPLLAVYLVLLLVYLLRRACARRRRDTLLVLVSTIRYNFQRGTEWRAWLWSLDDRIRLTHYLALHGNDALCHDHEEPEVHVREYANPFRSLKRLRLSHALLRYGTAQYLLLGRLIATDTALVLALLHPIYCGPTLLLAHVLAGQRYAFYEGTNKTTRRESRFYTHPLIRFVERLCFRHAAGIVSRQRAPLDFVAEYGLDPRRFLCVPHWFPRPAARELARPAILAGAPGPTLFYFGRLTRDKRAPLVVEAFAALAARDPRPRLLLCGDGEPEVIDALERHPLFGTRLVRLPYQNSDALAGLIRHTDIHVHPTGGKTLMESGLAAKPVIVFAREAWDYDLVENGVSGLTVPMDDAAAMTTAMQRLLDEPHLAAQLGRELERRVLAFTDRDAFRRELAAAYDVLLSRGT